MEINKEKIKKEILSYIFIFLGVFGFKSMFFEPNHIPSGSMLPSMAIGDFIIVNKMQYGLKVPFSEWVGDPIYLTEFKEPKKGDIVVFEFPEKRSILFVKRLVGLPGDTIEVYDNHVFINGEEVKGAPVSAKQTQEFSELYDEKAVMLDLDFNIITNGPIKHVVAINKAHPGHKGQAKVTVPEGHYFMMGDNRDFSSDSRVWGFVPKSHVRGKALFVWFNMVYPWSNEPFHFRPQRIGTTFYNGVE
jgi:signal peptidase I